MVIGIMLSGLFVGLAVTIGSLLVGFPLWLALLLYPVAGALGSMGFVGIAFGRSNVRQHGVSSGLAADFH